MSPSCCARFVFLKVAEYSSQLSYLWRGGWRKELLRLADASLADLEAPVFTFGTIPLKVFYLIWRQGGVVYTSEVVRMGVAAGLSRSKIFEALTRLDEDGFITRVGPRIQVRKRD